MLVGELRQLLPENEEELGALVLQQIAITFDVTEEKFRAVAKRDDVLRRIVPAIELPRHVFREVILDAALLDGGQRAPQDEAVASRHLEARDPLNAGSTRCSGGSRQC